MASWAFILTDRNFVPQGEILNASSRQVALPLSKLSTASFQVRLDNPLVDQLMTTEGYIKCYRRTRTTNWALQHYGPIISAEAAGDKDKGTVTVNSVGAGWILQKRLAGKSKFGAAYVATDRAIVARALIDQTNSDNETGIDTTIYTPSSGSTVTYTAGPYKPVMDCITELATALDGFDWTFNIIDNFANGMVTGQKIAAFLALPLITNVRPDAVFEWGVGRNNVSTFKWQVSRDTQANKVYHNTANGPDAPGFPTVSALDAQSITDWKLLEDLANADLLDNDMRQNLVNEHVAVRAQPRQVFEFSPHIDPSDAGRLPIYGVEWFLGDQVRARVAFGSKTKFDAMVRCYGVQFDINEFGVEQQTLTLVEES